MKLQRYLQGLVLLLFSNNKEIPIFTIYTECYLALCIINLHWVLLISITYVVSIFRRAVSQNKMVIQSSFWSQMEANKIDYNFILNIWQGMRILEDISRNKWPFREHFKAVSRLFEKICNSRTNRHCWLISKKKFLGNQEAVIDKMISNIVTQRKHWHTCMYLMY